MATYVLTNEENLSSIADAIRTKNGDETATYTPSEMAPAILSLSGSGVTPEELATKVSKAGDTMTGDLSFDLYKGIYFKFNGGVYRFFANPNNNQLELYTIDSQGAWVSTPFLVDGNGKAELNASKVRFMTDTVRYAQLLDGETLNFSVYDGENHWVATPIKVNANGTLTLGGGTFTGTVTASGAIVNGGDSGVVRNAVVRDASGANVSTICLSYRRK